MKKILFICYGNICRSPMAEILLNHLLRAEGLEAIATASSAATSPYEAGMSLSGGTREVLARHGIPLQPHHSRTATREDYAAYDEIYVMDRHNYYDSIGIFQGDPENKIHLLMNLLGEERDVADPWYTGDYEASWEDISAACAVLVERLKKEQSRK